MRKLMTCIRAIRRKDAFSTEKKALLENYDNKKEEKIVCQAIDILTLADVLAEKYQYDNPKHIQAMIIAANLDYISEEELSVVLATYHYTMEELGRLLYDAIDSIFYACYNTQQYYEGNRLNLSEKELFDNRIHIEDIMLDVNDQKIAAMIYKNVYAQCHLLETGPLCTEFEDATSGELFCSYYITFVLGIEVLENPIDVSMKCVKHHKSDDVKNQA